MTPRRRKTLGNIFLVFTLLALVTALGNGGFWWASVLVCAAVALWGIGPTKNGSSQDGSL